MKEYYTDDYCTIYNADCVDVVEYLPNGSLLLTDPPYGLGDLSGTISKKRNKNAYIDYNDTLENIEIKIVPTIKKYIEICGGRAIITPGYNALFYYPKPSAIGVFYQPAACGMNKWGRADSQPILYYGRDPRIGKTIDFCSFQLTEKGSCAAHPCSKPIKAWSKLLTRGSLEGETVIDPFMGSGTTLLAAKNLGRKCIGIEIEEKYCEIAANRLRQEKLL